MRTALLLLLFVWPGVANVARAQATPDYTVTDETVEVTPGTTMFDLVRDFYPNHRNDWLRVARDLADANPQAFRNGDPGALIVGKTIALIDYGDGFETETETVVAQAVTPTPTPTPDEAREEAAIDAPTDGDEQVNDPPAPAAASDQALRGIATITRLRGSPEAIDRNNRKRTLRPNATVYRGDTLLTGDDQPLSMVMHDGAVIRVRANSRLMIEKYRSGDTPDRGSIMTLSQGGLRLTTGDLAELRNGVLINTAVATLTTTGGDLAIALCNDGRCALPGVSSAVAPGLYAGVALGELTVSNNTGSVAAVRGEVLRVRNADLAPQAANDLLGVVFNPNELLALDLQPDEPLGFFAWFRQRFFSLSPSPNAARQSDEADADDTDLEASN